MTTVFCFGAPGNMSLCLESRGQFLNKNYPFFLLFLSSVSDSKNGARCFPT